jgi:hypothetical protein
MVRKNNIRLNFLCILLSFLITDFVYANCDDALRRCENECTSATTFFNYEKGEYQSLN